ncbi:exosortase/archaeosortase family protein [Thermococcus waiotapuensis]|uniref:Archaeosortase/exosortase family protein n=1 Tax=Thermococcus waiotapuensis TaxID=90909 RepID=A0AAE4T4F7_9EURY|nr:archaeosortase/exosortase family protein [Thermococcus waiotapuensis]MDV3104721.1 archaeosortase/exosortase family protein [Thermococcus waiotapuensis]
MAVKIRTFEVLVVLLTTAVFLIYRTPFTLYAGLIYALTLRISEKRALPKRPGLDLQAIIGASFIMISPAFLVIRLGEYTSPSAFLTFLLLGLQLILYELRGLEVPSIVVAGGATIALLAKTDLISEAIDATSALFVDVTSILVKGLVTLSGVPIKINGNVAVVRKSIVIIGSGCSGFDAFVIYILATLLLIYLRKSSRKEAALLLLGAIGIIPLNAVRIFTLLVIGYYSGMSFLELFHSHLGDLMFVAYVFIYWWAVLRWKKQVKGEEKLTAS